MKIAEINILPNGSTGKIMFQIANTARKYGHSVKTYTPVRFLRGKKVPPVDVSGHFSWGSRAEACIHYYLGTLLGTNGMHSYLGTNQLIKDLKKFAPDIIHLHNLHMYCIDLPMLFRYIKKHHIKVVWTLHDCWSFTGHCPHFTIARCDKWKTGCGQCPQPRVYPKMYLDTSRWMYKKKKKWFSGIEDMTLVTPSAWLAGLVKQSFMKEYSTVVIHNGIDLSIFKPTDSDFRERYGLDGKKVILSVSFGWGFQKGLDVLVELAKRLPDDYKLVLVGTNDAVDAQLPDNIISIHSTEDQTQLAQIYTAADVFINPTREDTFPTVNMESLACGTPVLTFETGGSPEIIDENCGSSVLVNDIDALEKELIRICTQKPYTRQACLARAASFDKYQRFEEYINLYKEVMDR